MQPCNLKTTLCLPKSLNHTTQTTLFIQLTPTRTNPEGFEITPLSQLLSEKEGEKFKVVANGL